MLLLHRSRQHLHFCQQRQSIDMTMPPRHWLRYRPWDCGSSATTLEDRRCTGTNPRSGQGCSATASPQSSRMTSSAWAAVRAPTMSRVAACCTATSNVSNGRVAARTRAHRQKLARRDRKADEKDHQKGECLRVRLQGTSRCAVVTAPRVKPRIKAAMMIAWQCWRTHSAARSKVDIMHPPHWCSAWRRSGWVDRLAAAARSPAPPPRMPLPACCRWCPVCAGCAPAARWCRRFVRPELQLPVDAHQARRLVLAHAVDAHSGTCIAEAQNGRQPLHVFEQTGAERAQQQFGRVEQMLALAGRGIEENLGALGGALRRSGQLVRLRPYIPA